MPPLAAVSAPSVGIALVVRSDNPVRLVRRNVAASRPRVWGPEVRALFAATPSDSVGPVRYPRPWQVLGGPGTGKSSLLVDLAATRLVAGSDPESVLLLTHSKPAAVAVRDAITEHLLGHAARRSGYTEAGAASDLDIPGATRDPMVRTVHSYAFSVLRRHAATHGNPPPRLLTGAEQDVVLREMLRGDLTDIAAGATDLWPSRLKPALGLSGFADQLRDLMLRATERGIGPEDLIRLGREHDRPEWVAAGRFATRYEQAMLLRWSVGVEAPEASAPALNAAELVGAALDALAGDPELLAAERSRVRCLLVDDAQHLDPQAAVLVRVLASGAATTVIAGDPDQGIFAFRGADSRFLAELDTPAEQRIVLRHNHRSGAAVRTAAARIAARLPGAAPQRPNEDADTSPDDDGAQVRVRVLGSPAKEAALIADHLRRAHLTEGVPWSRMAVIVRSVPLLLPPLRRALSAAGVPVRQPAPDTPLARRRGAAWMLSALRAILAGESAPRGPGSTAALFDADDALDLLSGPLGSADQISLRRLRRGIRRTALELARSAPGPAAPQPGPEPSLVGEWPEPPPEPVDEPPLPDPFDDKPPPDDAWPAPSESATLDPFADAARLADDADWYGLDEDWFPDDREWDGLPPDYPDDLAEPVDPVDGVNSPDPADPNRFSDPTDTRNRGGRSEDDATAGFSDAEPVAPAVSDDARTDASAPIGIEPDAAGPDGVEPGAARRPDVDSARYIDDNAAASAGLVDRSSAEILRDLLLGIGDRRIPAGLTEVEFAPLRRAGDALERARRVRRRGGGLEDVLWALWTGSRLERHWVAQSERGGTAGQQADRDLDAAVALFDAAAAYVDRLPGASIEGFVEYLIQQEIPNDRMPTTRREDAVDLLSAHAAAGREWEVVAVAGVQEGIWPDPRPRGTLLQTEDLVDLAAGIDTDEPVSRAAPILAEERRLLYVACGRARRSLLVTAVESVAGDRDLVPSRFLAELLGHDDDGEPGALPVAEPGRALAMHALIAELRGVVCDPDTDPDRRMRAAEQLARLAHAGVPGTDPDDWYGTAELSSTEPLWDDDDPVALSPSTVELLQTCPLRWALERNGGSDGHNPHAVKGNLVHTLVQALAGKIPPAQVRAALGRAWQAVEPGAGWYSRQERRRAEAMLDTFMTWVNNTRGELTQAGVEVPVDHVLPARDDSEPPVRIRGRIDRLERDAFGRFVIVDVKTGKTVVGKGAAAEHAQLATYQVAAAYGALDDTVAAERDDPGRIAADPDETGTDRAPGGARLVYVAKPTAHGVATERDQPPLDAEALNAWRAAIHAAAAATKGPSFLAMRNDGCRHCAVRAGCPIQDTGRQVTDE
ncbi:ATP-dependent DNA helicase [Nocardia brevicatena]|uniref:PD-(D/E)XK nuclease family protein n=1 Tax=Nocardia brevicatena TaxID=37327 RepID=UPI0009FFAA28